VNSFIDGIKLHEYSMNVHVQYKNRFITYLKDNKGITNDMIDLTNSLVSSLGIDYPVEINTPVVEALEGTQFISLFLDQVCSIHIHHSLIIIRFFHQLLQC